LQVSVHILNVILVLNNIKVYIVVDADVVAAGSALFSSSMYWNTTACGVFEGRSWSHVQVCYLLSLDYVFAQGHCRISPPGFLADCCKRRLDRGTFVLLCFALFTFSGLRLVVYCLYF